MHSHAETTAQQSHDSGSQSVANPGCGNLYSTLSSEPTEAMKIHTISNKKYI